MVGDEGTGWGRAEQGLCRVGFGSVWRGEVGRVSLVFQDWKTARMEAP